MSINSTNLSAYNISGLSQRDIDALQKSGSVKIQDLSGKAYSNLAPLTNDNVSFTSKPPAKSSVAEELKSQLKKTKSEQGLIGKAWDGIKNLFGMKAGSNNVEKTIKQLENGEITEEQAQAALQKYQDGQKMCVDVVGDIVSGIVAVAAIAAAPLTGGASLLLAAGVGAATKVAIKGIDASVGGRSYSAKDFTYDIITGSINGLMAPITNALGGAAGTGVAKACGLNIGKAALKEGAEESAKAAGKSFLTRLLAKQGAEYVAKEGTKVGIKTIGAKVAAYGIDMAIDGSLSGATDAVARNIAKVANGEEVTLESFTQDVKQGTIGGLIAAPVIGGGFRIAGKAGKKIGSELFTTAGTKTASTSGDIAAGTAGVGVLGGLTVGRQLSGAASDAASDSAVKESSEAIADAASSSAIKQADDTVTQNIGDATGKQADNITNAANGGSTPKIETQIDPSSKSAVEISAASADEIAEAAVIKQGNPYIKVADKGSLRSQIDFNDPMYKDTAEFARHLETKIMETMGVTTATDINTIISKIAKETGADASEVAEVISRLTQFSSYKEIATLGKELGDLDIGSLYKTGVSSNNALNYVGVNKYQFTDIGYSNGLSGNKSAFILDDGGLSYLEKLKAAPKWSPEESLYLKFVQDVKAGKIKLVSIDGWDVKIGDSYFSYSFFDGDINLEAFAASVIKKMKNSGASLDEVLNQDSIQRARAIIGDSNLDITVIKNSNATGHSATEIAERLAPNMPTTAQIRATIDEIVETNYKGSGKEEWARETLSKYYDMMISAYSPESMTRELKIKYSLIKDSVEKMGKNIDKDVVYACPTNGNSFDLVALQYAKANGIDPTKIILFNGIGKPPVDLTGKVLVVLDDFVGTGDSMMNQKFYYSSFLTNIDCKDTRVIISPISNLQQGASKVQSDIASAGRQGIDEFIPGIDVVDFKAKFNPNNDPNIENELSKLLGGFGYKSGGGCAAFQYMLPDNNSAAAGLLLRWFLNNPASSKCSGWYNMLDAVTKRAKTYSP